MLMVLGLMMTVIMGPTWWVLANTLDQYNIGGWHLEI